MSHGLKPKISFLPIFIALFLTIGMVISLFVWSHYEQKKEHLQLSLNHALETQKNYLNSLMAPVNRIKSNWSKKQRTQEVLSQTHAIWQKEVGNDSNLSLALFQQTDRTQKTPSSNNRLISVGDLQNTPSQSLLVSLLTKIPVNYLQALNQPSILQKQISANNEQFQIVASYRAPTILEYIESVWLYITAALLAGLLFSLFTVSIWRHRTMKTIDHAQNRYQQFVKNANDWLWEIDKYGTLSYCSENSEKIFGYPAEEMIGLPIYSFLYPNSKEQDEQNLEMYISNGVDISNQEVHFNSSKARPVLLELNAQAYKDEKGQVTAYRGTGRDMTEQKQKQDSIISMVYYDALTQLPNRESLVKKLDQHLNQVMQRKDLVLSALIFIDLDDFKDINDYQSHEVGNALLKEIAHRLSSYVAQKDIIFRLSSDQFVILVISPNRMLMTEFKLRLESFVSEVLSLVNKPLQVEGHNALVSASAGIAMIPQDGRTTSELLSHADSAMFQAKRDGKNRYRYFDASMREQEDHRKQVAKELKQAIENKEFQLYYQLQIDSITDQIYGMEALIRWPHPTRHAIVTPDEFIQVAIDSNHIQAIDEWVIEQTAKDLAELKSTTNTTIPTSINLSAKTMENSRLPEMLDNCIKQYNLVPADLRIEVTETGLLKNIDKTIEILNTLKDHGISSSIDDFGTGYSSLSYLQKLPVDALKIDKSFIDGIGTSSKDLQICKSIIQLAQNLDKKIIAEGVQSEQQKALLEAEGCHIVQGYLYSKPMPISEIIIQLSLKKSANPDWKTKNKTDFRLVKGVAN